MAEKRQSEHAHIGYSDTPILKSSGYHVHDGERPQPPIVTPGKDNSPPSDATVLFDGTNLSKWKGKDSEAKWKVEDGYMEVAPKSGDIETKDHFGNIQLHLEFASPTEIAGESQGRGNSGVFLMGRYEIQVLDNYDNLTYADGTVGAIYGQFPPLANSIKKPGAWNAFDIFWGTPIFEADDLVKPAHVTVLLNGIVLHHYTELLGITSHKVLTEYEPHGAKGPIRLQNHGNPVRFRNIWVREIKEYDE